MDLLNLFHILKEEVDYYLLFLFVFTVNFNERNKVILE